MWITARSSSPTHFKLACARLNVRHAHTALYAPQSKGKIERFMGRVDSFLAEWHCPRRARWRPQRHLHRLARRDGYKRGAHEALDGRTPQAVFTADPQPLRAVDQQTLHDAFLREETRKVDKTGCVKFRGTLVEIGARTPGNGSRCATPSCLTGRTS